MNQVSVFPMGGMGNVTQNMFLYQVDEEMLIVDCGIGFPDMYMPGVDVLIPDISYLLKQLESGKKIVGMILTHGHDDHIAALPYILPSLPEFPIYASALTAGFAANRMRDGGIEREIKVVTDHQWFEITQKFQAQPIAMTHSVPDTRHYAIKTPAGVFYHGSDFKLDPNPVDGVKPDFAHITELGNQGVLCMMIDCLRVERSEWTKSESTVGPVLDTAMGKTKGKFIVTLMSSHIHRIQQIIDSAAKHGRKVAFVGRSVEQNVEAAVTLKKLHLPQGIQVDKRDLSNLPDSQVCVIIAGSQGQEGSSLVRAVYGDHPMLQIKPSDQVVFSADAIPGNEVPYYAAIDELCRNGVHVIYPDLEPNLHQSGHASAPEQQELLGMVKPQFVMPIGGADRHRVKFVELVADQVGVAPERVLIPGHGEVLGFGTGRPEVIDQVTLQARTVDGLGVGDVGPVVLADRRALSQAGMIVIIVPRTKRGYDLKHVSVVSRGFVFMKEADEVIEFIKRTTAEIVNELGRKAKDDEVKRTIEKRLGRKLYKVIQREPVIMAAIVEV